MDCLQQLHYDKKNAIAYAGNVIAANSNVIARQEVLIAHKK